MKFYHAVDYKQDLFQSFDDNIESINSIGRELPKKATLSNVVRIIVKRIIESTSLRESTKLSP